jgi:hypothetical protein
MFKIKNTAVYMILRGRRGGVGPGAVTNQRAEHLCIDLVKEIVNLCRV